MKEQREFKVTIELNKSFSVCFEADEDASVERACQYVLDNYMGDIRYAIMQYITAEEVER